MEVYHSDRPAHHRERHVDVPEEDFDVPQLRRAARCLPGRDPRKCGEAAAAMRGSLCAAHRPAMLIAEGTRTSIAYSRQLTVPG